MAGSFRRDGPAAQPSRKGKCGQRLSLVCLAWLALLAISCGGSRRDPALKAARQADIVWRTRASPGGLDAALQAYLSANLDHPDDGRILWRLARTYTLLGDLEPESALRHYASAREFGLRCLMLEPSFAGLVQARGGIVIPAAAKELTEEVDECLVWTVIAWSRWMQTRGSAGVGIDLAPLLALGEQASVVAGDWGSGRGYHAYGLALAMVPDILEPNFAVAEEALQKAIAAAPDRLPAKVDYATLVLLRTGREEEARQMLEEIARAQPDPNGPELLEDRCAIQWARRQLDLEPAVFSEASAPSP